MTDDEDALLGSLLHGMRAIQEELEPAPPALNACRLALEGVETVAAGVVLAQLLMDLVCREFEADLREEMLGSIYHLALALIKVREFDRAEDEPLTVLRRLATDEEYVTSVIRKAMHRRRRKARQ